MASTGDHLWIRPTTAKEEYFEVGHQKGVTQVYYCLDLMCLKPLDDELVRSALTHLYKKVPLLRLCLRQREGQLWLREMARCDIDFKSLGHEAQKDVEDELMSYTYNTAEGPMWCVRFLRDVPSETSSLQDPDFSHKYTLLLGIHHSLGDGFTNLKICGFMHSLLDDVAAGRPVDDDEQLGEHLGDEFARQLYEDERRRLTEDPELLKECKEELLGITTNRPLLLDILPEPRNEDVRTCSVEKHFDADVTSSFRKKCKAEGVTVHSGLVGAISVAFVKILEGVREVPDEFELLSGHDVNLRRYYTGDTSNILGVHLPTFGFKMSFRVSKDPLRNFWPSVKAFHEKFKSALNSRSPVRNVALRMMMRSKSENFDDYFKDSGVPDCYFTVSNVGDVTSMVPGDGDCVRVIKLATMSSLRNMTNFMCFYVKSYKGRLHVNLGFSTRFLDYAMANRILDLMSTAISAACQA